ncbi:MAG: TolB family protein [Planctomycetaceae bacterium]
MPTLSRSAQRLVLVRWLFLAIWGGFWGLIGTALAAPPESPAGWIGYNLHRTNLPGGRWANVRTNRAMLIRGDGTGNRLVGEPLLDEPGCWTQFVGWSPDGTLTILGQAWESEDNARWEEEHQTFRFTAEGWQYDSFLFDPQTGQAENVTAVDRVSFYNTGLFFWNNDPNQLGFTALIDGNSKPFRMDRKGQHKVDLTKNSSGFAYGFSSSPDGRRISYHESYQVFLADADGKNRIHVQTGHPFVFAPRWSPDGNWLLFVSGEHYNCHPHIVRADGKGLKKLADRNGYRGVTEFLDVPDFHGGSSDIPVWSAKGDRVFYTAQVEDRVELFEVTLDGQSRQLTQSAPGTSHYHLNPSPDGEWLLYGSNRRGVRNLYLRRLNDQRETPLTNLPYGYAAMHAHWQPTPKP